MGWLSQATDGYKDFVGDMMGIYHGTTAQNQANRQMSREQMQFQREMSNTAHSREVTDLRAAGLNPILSANSGASTPVGSSAHMQGASMDGPVNTAKDFLRVKNERELLKSQLELNQSVASKNTQDVQTGKSLQQLYDVQRTTAKGDPRYWAGKGMNSMENYKSDNMSVPKPWDEHYKQGPIPLRTK